MPRLLVVALAVLALGCAAISRGAAAPHPVAAAQACGTGVTARAGATVTDRGAVAGVREGESWAYKGIPYAAPPVGALRWQPPQEPDCWPGERPATEFGASCPQMTANGVGGQEDCLTLNVWTPAAAADSPRPVLVFIHGGGNVQGTSSQRTYDGRELAARGGGVVVTLNYRLGIFGYLAHPALSAESARGISGNYGIMDQLAALRWVQRNIAAFGGDPARVLVFGESAGAVNVCVLVASPQAAGLFSSALMQSGGCNQPLLGTAERSGQEVAEGAGCADAATAAACLRALSVEAAVRARVVPIAAGSLGRQPYGPVVDGFILEGSPLAIIAAGRHNRVPFAVGANADETAGLNPPRITDEDDYRAALTRQFGAQAAAALMAQYPVSEHESAFQAYVRLSSDAAFVCPSRTIARAAVRGGSPAYRYFFTQELSNRAAGALGAFHGLELAYLFRTLGAASAYRATADDLAVSDAMIAAWTSLAATGNPNAPGAPAWPAYDIATDAHLVLGTPVTAAEGVRTAKCDFWDRATGIDG